ncbi:MAG: methyltransferase family protein [Acidobacteriota bacterium]
MNTDSLRWPALAILVASLCISAYFRRRARAMSENIPRQREGGLVLAARATAGLLALSAIVTHVLTPREMAWATFVAPAWLPWAGLALGVLVVPAVFWVLKSLGSNVSETVLTKDAHQLVTSGPYRWVRHPLYTAGIALLASVGLMLASWLVLVFAGIALVLFRFLVIPLEERRLVDKFGDRYLAYRLGTGALVPRVKGSRR